jgi:hypothetical protein
MVLEDIWQVLQQENNNMRQAFEQIKARLVLQNPEDVGNQQILQPILQPTKEPRVSLLEKFYGIRFKFQGFVNQIQLIFQLQP